MSPGNFPKRLFYLALMRIERSCLLTIVAAAVVSLCGCSSGDSKMIANTVAEPAALTPQSTRKNETLLFLEARVKSDPDDFIAYNKLVSEYLQQVRETGDIAYLDLALKSAKASLAALPAERNKGGLAALARAQFSSHDFAGSRDSAMRLAEIDPGKGYVYQLLGDAYLELGDYDQAKAAFKKMDELGGIQTLTQVGGEQRLARIAVLFGDTAGAKSHLTTALKLAEKPPGTSPETIAWCQWQLGEMVFAAGDYVSAEKYYRESLATFPDYFRSLASLGRVRAAQGDLPGAIEQYEKVVKILPDPNFVAALGDLYQLAGRGTDAENQYALVENIGHLSALSGVLYNRQLALFYADHGLKSEEAYQNAAKEYEVRRDIYGADAVAWTSLKAGKIQEAQVAMKEALKLGTKDAKLFYHAGLIENAAGNKTEAKRLLSLSLKTSPVFDPLQSNAAKAALEALK